MELKVEMIGREVIKPASPAPHDRLQLSLLDFNIPSVYVSMVLFYNLADQAEKSMDVISRRLKSSLSHTLSRFYPLAGKKEGVSISCNDEGSVFTEARTDVLLSDFLGNLDINSLKVFLPTLTQGESPESWPLLNVQVTFFGSASGFAVGVSVSHNICDAASMSTFVRGWAASAKGDSSDELSTPLFAETTIFPPADISVPNPELNVISEILKKKCVTNRFVFESDKIKELKIVAASEIVPDPTRVEAITSLIWRCARNASNANLVVPRPSVMSQAMDLRVRIPTILSPDTIGNLQSGFFLKRGPGRKIEISETVAEFRKEKEKVIEMMRDDNSTLIGLKIMSGIANYMSDREPNTDEYITSSWCRKGFYEVDFGWGRPAWVGPARHAIQDDMMFTVLMDAKDGEGVEAWVGLNETDMTAFICDQDLLTYASLNPPVLI